MHIYNFLPLILFVSSICAMEHDLPLNKEAFGKILEDEIQTEVTSASTYKNQDAINYALILNNVCNDRNMFTEELSDIIFPTIATTTKGQNAIKLMQLENIKITPFYSQSRSKRKFEENFHSVQLFWPEKDCTILAHHNFLLTGFPNINVYKKDGTLHPFSVKTFAGHMICDFTLVKELNDFLICKGIISEHLSFKTFRRSDGTFMPLIGNGIKDEFGDWKSLHCRSDQQHSVVIDNNFHANKYGEVCTIFIYQITGNTYPILSCTINTIPVYTFAVDQGLIFSTHADKTLKIWNTIDGKCLFSSSQYPQLPFIWNMRNDINNKNTLMIAYPYHAHVFEYMINIPSKIRQILPCLLAKMKGYELMPDQRNTNSVIEKKIDDRQWRSELRSLYDKLRD